MSRYYKNVILCGEIDYFCLLCEEPFEFPEQVEKHIRWEQHRKNMKGLSYNSKYKKDFIYKIGDYFYCEICNYVTDLASVTNHVKDYKHLFRKTNPTNSINSNNVTRKRNGLVNYHGMTMTKFQWHGIVDNHCVLCNVPIQDAEHIKRSDHMVALVQSRMMVNDDLQYIRKINNYTMYCFTCQKFFDKDSTHSHDTDDTKKNAIEECDRAQGDELEKAIVNKLLTPADEENKLYNGLIKKERKYFYIDLENGIARCFQCKSPVRKVTLDNLMAHRKAHSAENDDSDSSDDSCVYAEIVDHGKRRAAIAQYGKRHFVKLNQGGSKGYCSLCDVHISAHLSLVKQHVRGARHQGILFAKRLKKGVHQDNRIWYKPMKKSLHVYLRQILFTGESQVVCMNNSICVDVFSFMLILPIGDDKIKCFTCNEIYKSTEICQHCNTDLHMNKLVGASVMDIDYDSELADEFVREVQPNLYHCGFCNKLIPYWDETHLHLKSWKHIEVRKCKEVVYRVSQENCNKLSTFVGSKNRAALLKKLKSICILSCVKN